MAKTKEIRKSSYAQKIEYRKKLSGGKHTISTNKGQPKKLPFPLPLFQDA